MLHFNPAQTVLYTKLQPFFAQQAPGNPALAFVAACHTYYNTFPLVDCNCVHTVLATNPQPINTPCKMWPAAGNPQQHRIKQRTALFRIASAHNPAITQAQLWAIIQPPSDQANLKTYHIAYFASLHAAAIEGPAAAVDQTIQAGIHAPPGSVIRHLCGCPLCIQIAHHSTGTQAQNLLDRDYHTVRDREILVGGAPNLARLQAYVAFCNNIPPGTNI